MPPPPAAARVARGDGIPSVAVLVETGTSWGRRVVAGVLEYARKNGPWHIDIAPHGPDEPVHVPPGWRGDGIIARIATRPAAKEIRATRAAVVNVSSVRLDGFNWHRVMTEPSAAARLAAETFWPAASRISVTSVIPPKATCRRNTAPLPICWRPSNALARFSGPPATRRTRWRGCGGCGNRWPFLLGPAHRTRSHRCLP